MMTAKVFENGRSQAVRLPKECRFDTDEVSVSKIGDIVMLIPKGKPFSSLLLGLSMFTDDYADCIRDRPLVAEEREEL